MHCSKVKSIEHSLHVPIINRQTLENTISPKMYTKTELMGNLLGSPFLLLTLHLSIGPKMQLIKQDECLREIIYAIFSLVGSISEVSLHSQDLALQRMEDMLVM